MRKIPKSHNVRIWLLVFCLLVTAPPYADSNESGATDCIGLLFYKTDCPGCTQLIQKTLPAALNKYDNKNRILAINNASPEGGQLFLELLLTRNLSLSIQLPLLVTGNAAWSGLTTIEQELPDYLSRTAPDDAIDLSSIGELRSLAEFASSGQPSTAFWISQQSNPVQTSLLSRFKSNFLKDPRGNSLALLVLLGMLVVTISNLYRLTNKSRARGVRISVLYPVLALVGIFVAYYLFHSYLSRSELSCGPVGDCNTVQQSDYSYIFGYVPISFLGLVMYLICILSWLGSRLIKDRVKIYFSLAAWGVPSLGVLFFLYLTFLEPFVIGATCIWCISAAIITTLLSFLSLKSAREAIHLPPA